MKIGLIDVDGHHFPNLALMRISAYHKSIGDDVEWWYSDFIHYDIVYMSKIFSNEYSPDVDEPLNADMIIKGGTGYCIHLVDGKENFNSDVHKNLPDYIERMKPDYSIYPQYNFAVAMTSRGCPRQCDFCIVAKKEGCMARKVADVMDFYNGQPHIEVLDPNITACKEKRDLFSQYRELCKPRKGPTVTFSQGLDIRLLDGNDIDDLLNMRVKRLHFAWDNPNDDLEPKFKEFKKAWGKADCGTVYVLTNYNSTMEQNLYRIYVLRELGFDPFVMVYDRSHATQEIIDLQRWCNNKIIFKSCYKFSEYNKTTRRGYKK